MEKKKIICASICGCVALVCILAAAIIPPVLMSVLKSQVRSSTEMRESIHNVWGKVPGKMKAIPTHMYHFFHITNPEAVFYDGALPVLTEMNGYSYEEFDDYLTRSYTDKDGSDGNEWVHFYSFQWVDVTKHCVWRNNTSPNDKVTLVNLGPFGAWDQMKHLPAEKVALPALYSLALGLNHDMTVSIYAQGILSLLFGGEQSAWKEIFQPAGVSQELFQEIWSDQRFGWSNPTSFSVWVMAYMENLYNSQYFAYPINPSGSIVAITSYFSELTPANILGIFAPNGKSIWVQLYNVVTDMIDDSYCSPNNITACDSMKLGALQLTLGALQWTQQFVTMNPPLGTPAPSIASSNATVYGYPEISYFMNETGLLEKFPDVQFSIDEYFSLFNYNLETGWPSGKNNTLLDWGNMMRFFAFGRAGNFSTISTYFNLSCSSEPQCENKARVLWDYVNTIVSITALQGNTDYEVFNEDNRGITSELSIGSLGSQALYQTLYMVLPDVFQLELTTRYAYSQFLLNQVTCLDAVSEDFDYVCHKTQLKWSNNTAGFRYWMAAYMGGQDSPAWDSFMQMAGITDKQMQALFTNLTKDFAGFEEDIKAYYNCTNSGPRCHSFDLVEMQWAYSGVSMNLPGEMAEVMNLTGLHSIMDWGEPFKSMFVGRPEYGAYVLDRKLPSTYLLSQASIPSILSFDSILCSVPFQRLFVLAFLGNYDDIEVEFGVPDGLTMVNYLRYMTDKFGFGGMYTTRTVDEWLWTGVDPFLEGVMTTNPLTGGDPSTDPTSVRLGSNQTREQFYDYPRDYRHAMNTGRDDIGEVRWFRLYNGLPYINYLTKMYFGHNQWGPIIERVRVNPWTEEVPLMGGDTWNFQPNVGDDSNITFFLDQNQRIAVGTFVDRRTEHGFDIFRYRVGPELLSNVSVNPSFARFYQYGPNGVVNQSSVMGMPLFVSKPYFLDGDPVLDTLVNYTEPQLDVPKNYESYLDIEKYSGATFYITEKIQFNTELKPDALFPNLGLKSLQSVGYRTYVPTFYQEKIFAYSDHTIKKFYDPIKVVLHIIKWTQIVGYTVGALAVLCVAGIFLKNHINKKRREKGLVPGEQGQGYREMEEARTADDRA